MPKSRGRRTAAALAAALLGAFTLGGCGIRPTQVPVDAGPAPSRVPCEVTGDTITQQDQDQAQGVPVRVYLVCASQLVALDRTALIGAKKLSDSPLQSAQALLGQLQSEPSSSEEEAGFSTAVRGPLTVVGPRDGDPAGTLRLSRQPEDLAPTALSQIVCTLVESRAAATDGSVLLGGPGGYAPRAYQCPAALKERPEEGVPAGELPSPGVSS